jgi:hypothetical protein
MTQKTSYLKSLILLSQPEIIHFTEVFRLRQYQIVSILPSSDVDCERLLDFFKDDAIYHTILDDSQGTFNYFGLKYLNSNGIETHLPIGVFGISKRYEVRFPLLLNDFWRDFLMINKNDFCYICGINDNQDYFYGKMLELRRSFVEAVFNYYANIDKSYISAMAWDLRSEKSLTRILAEALGYKRIEFIKSEIYSSSEINEDRWNYLKKSLLTWFKITNEVKQIMLPETATHRNLSLIARGFVGLKIP